MKEINSFQTIYVFSKSQFVFKINGGCCRPGNLFFNLTSPLNEEVSLKKYGIIVE